MLVELLNHSSQPPTRFPHLVDLAGAVADYGDLVHAFDLLDRHINLDEIHAVTSYFDLGVSASLEDQSPVNHPPEISRAVEDVVL